MYFRFAPALAGAKSEHTCMCARCRLKYCGHDQNVAARASKIRSFEMSNAISLFFHCRPARAHTGRLTCANNAAYDRCGQPQESSELRTLQTSLTTDETDFPSAMYSMRSSKMFACAAGVPFSSVSCSDAAGALLGAIAAASRLSHESQATMRCKRIPMQPLAH